MSLGCALLLVSQGCGDRCRDRQAWADIPVVAEDPDDEVQAKTVAGASRALGWFASWSGEERVCVSSMTARDTVEDEASAGDFQWPSGRINLLAGASGTTTITWHELCHAVDADLDVSLDHPDLFAASDVERDGSYSTRSLRARESFARACDNGPRDTVRARIWEVECGVDSAFDLDVAETVRRAVYPNAAPLPWAAPTLDVTLGEPWTAPDPGEDWRLVSVAVAGDALVFQYIKSEGGVMGIVFADPFTGAAGELVELPDPTSVSTYLHLIQGEDGAYLNTSADVGRVLWRFFNGRITQVNPKCAESIGDRAQGGVMWFSPNGLSDPLAVEGCDMATGERVTAPSLSVDGYHYASRGGFTVPQLGEVLGRLAMWWQGAGLTWVDEAGDWQRLELPAHLKIEMAQPTPSGDWLLVVSDERIEGESTVTYSSLVELDPGTGAFFTPTDPCPLTLPEGLTSVDQLLAGDGWAVLVKGVRLYDPEPRLYPVALSH